MYCECEKKKRCHVRSYSPCLRGLCGVRDRAVTEALPLNRTTTLLQQEAILSFPFGEDIRQEISLLRM